MKPTHYCQNCDWRGTESQLDDIQDLHQRVDPGEPMPAGECPECGALCHEIPADEKAIQAVQQKVLAQQLLLDQKRRLVTALAELATAAARIVEDDAKPTLVHMRELNRSRRRAVQLLDELSPQKTPRDLGLHGSPATEEEMAAENALLARPPKTKTTRNESPKPV